MKPYDKEYLKNIIVWAVVWVILGVILVLGIKQCKEILPIQDKPNTMVMISGNSLIGICPPSFLKPTTLTSLVDDIVECESNWRENAVGEAGEIGVAQFMPKTWEWMSEISGIKGDLYDTHDQILMLRWALKNGYEYHWTCYNKVR